MARVPIDVFDSEEYESYRPSWGSGPMPLWMFDKAFRDRIAEAVAQPKPPPKWIGNDLCQMVSRAWYEWYLQRGFDPDAKVARSYIPPRLRARVLQRDGLICQLCLDPVEEDDVHLDHRHPVARGGPTTFDNLQVTHSWCNLSKGARLVEELTEAA